MKRILMALLMVVFALTTGGIWGLAADKMTRGKEPWFTGLTVCGLAITIAVLAWLGGASRGLTAYSFIGTGSAFVALRLLFGKGSAIEAFAGLHVFAVFLLLVLPPLERARHRLQGSIGPNNQIQATPGCAFLLSQSQVPGAPDLKRWAADTPLLR